MEFGKDNEVDLLAHRLQNCHIGNREFTPSTNRGKNKNRSTEELESEEIDTVYGSSNAETSGMGRKSGRQGSGENNRNQTDRYYDKKQPNVFKILPAKGMDENEEEIEQQKFREEYQTLREFTIAKLARESAPKVQKISSNNDMKILQDFWRMRTLERYDLPFHVVDDLVQVWIDTPDLRYPIDVLKFYYVDNEDRLKLDDELKAMNVMYKSVQQITNEHVISSKVCTPGNAAVVWMDDLFKRAYILEVAVDPEDDTKKAKCYLLDEGLVVWVDVNHLYRAVEEFWNYLPKIINFRLAGLGRYGNTMEYRQFLINELMDTSSFELTARIVTIKHDGDKIILMSSKYPDRSINEVILTCLFSTFDMPTLLKTVDFYPAVRVVSCRKNAEMMIQLNTPVFHHLRELMSNNKNNRLDIAQRETGGLIEKNELYVYKDNVYGTCFRVLCKSSHLQTKTDNVRVLFIDSGICTTVNKWNLAHVNHLGSKKLPFNPLTMIPVQYVPVHLAGIASVDRPKFYQMFADENSFYLKKIENLPEDSSNANGVIAEVELFADSLENKTPGQSMSLNKLAIWTQTGTEIQLTEEVSGPACYCTDNFSSFATVELEGANWISFEDRFVELDLFETIDIVIFGAAKPGEFFVRPQVAEIDSMLYHIHKKCESYLAKNVRDEQWCGCDLVGRDFVVLADFGCNYLYRVRVLGKSLDVGEGVRQNEIPMVDCLLLDRGEVRSVPVADLQRMDPSVAEIPAQGALAVWSCSGFQWDMEDWNRLMKYVLYRHFKAKVLTLKRNSSGCPQFHMNLYEVGENNSVGYLLRPKDRFWEPKTVLAKDNYRRSRR